MVTINIQKKEIFLFTAMIFLILGLSYVVAVWDTTKTMYHSSEDVRVTISGTDYSLQEAINDDLISGGTSGSFGDWQDTDTGQVGGSGATLTTATNYQAATDGFVTSYSSGSWSGFTVYTDSNNPPSTIRARTSANYGTITMPVKAGDYWRTEGAVTAIHWIPLN